MTRSNAQQPRKTAFCERLQVATNPKKLLTAQIRQKKASVCIPFGFAKGTSVKNSDHVTIIDVAREAGVSYTTVSRVLNNRRQARDARARFDSLIGEKGGVYLSQ